MATGTRVMIVEDDREVRETVADYLASQGFEVRQAGDGNAMRKLSAAKCPSSCCSTCGCPGRTA